MNDRPNHNRFSPSHLAVIGAGQWQECRMRRNVNVNQPEILWPDQTAPLRLELNQEMSNRSVTMINLCHFMYDVDLTVADVDQTGFCN